MKKPKLLAGEHTVREYIDSLPKPWRDEIFEESQRTLREHLLRCRVLDYSEAINYAISWSGTRRGDSFWRNICIELSKNPGYLHTLEYESAEKEPRNL